MWPQVRPSSIVAGCLIFAGVAVFQFWQRADLSNLTGYPDEAAHFVTGVCVLDYCKTAFGSNPVAFAESYYARYPKVALGHWPPVFYVLQALWYAIAGAAPLQAVVLAGIIASTAILILFLRLQRLHGTWIALLSAGALLWLPTVRSSALLVMADMLASLFALLAVLAFADGRAEGARRSWMAFAGWLVLAVLTKQSALSLLGFVPAAWLPPAGEAVFTRKRLYRIGIGLGALVSLILLSYAASGVLALRPMPFPATLPRLWERLPLVGIFFAGAPLAMFLIASYGVLDLLVLKRNAVPADQAIHGKAALLWMALALAPQVLFREIAEDRYFLPAYFPLAMLFAQGLQSVRSELARRGVNARARLLAPVALTALCLMCTPRAGVLVQRTGYAEAAAAIPFDPVSPAILISSDSLGEGATIAERLIRDATRSGLVLRASKMLSSSDWLGRNHRLLAKSVPDVREFLDTIPVHFIVLDINGFVEPLTRAHHRLLEDAIRSDPAQFHLVGELPLYYDGHRRDGALRIYENLRARELHSGVIRIDMTSTLGRTLEVRLPPPGSAAAAPAGSPGSLPRWLLDLCPRPGRAPVSFQIAPDADSVAAAGTWGRIYVTAPPGDSWRVGDMPDWIQIIPRGERTGDGILTYQVSPNDSNERRAALIPVGKVTFRVSQARSSYISVPFRDRFELSPATWDLRAPDETSDADPPGRWVLEDQPGGGARAAMVDGGAGGGRSLMIEKRQPDIAPWSTLIYLPRIRVEPGAGYRLSLALKAQHPAQVWLSFGRRTAPYPRCGLYQPVDVSTAWKEITIPFRAEGDGCQVESNRLSIEAGRISGKLWLSQVSLTRESAQDRAPE